PKERTRVVCKVVKQLHGRVNGKPEEAHAEADEQCGQRSLAVEALHENSEEEHYKYRWGEICLYALKVVVQPFASLDYRYPQQPDDHHYGRGHPSDPNQLSLACVRSES